MWVIQKIVHAGDYDFAVVPEHPKAYKHGYVLLHRIVLENKLGRLLEDTEVTHHINENKKDNSPDNLEVKLRTVHSSDHQHLGRTFVELLCAYCSNTFLREKRNVNVNAKHYFCNRTCYCSWGSKKIEKTVPHGTNNAYNYWKCRCSLCKEAHTKHTAKYRYKKKKE